jgi:hypothetical protein
VILAADQDGKPGECVPKTTRELRQVSALGIGVFGQDYVGSALLPREYIVVTHLSGQKEIYVGYLLEQTATSARADS